MDDIVNNLARKLTDAISHAIATDPGVEAVRQEALEAGFRVRSTSIEAVYCFGCKIFLPARLPVDPNAPRLAQRRTFEISANDRRFLRSLRIGADETSEKEVE